jgi:hypothetical protein
MAVNHNDNDLSLVTAGTGPKHETQGMLFHGLFTIWSPGVSAGVVVLEGSPDGTNWTTLATRGFAVSSNFLDMAGDSAATPKNPVAVKFVRCRVSTAVVGGTVTAWVTSVSTGLPNDEGWSG